MNIHLNVSKNHGPPVYRCQMLQNAVTQNGNYEKLFLLDPKLENHPRSSATFRGFPIKNWVTSKKMLSSADIKIARKLAASAGTPTSAANTLNFEALTNQKNSNVSGQELQQGFEPDDQQQLDQLNHGGSPSKEKMLVTDSGPEEGYEAELKLRPVKARQEFTPEMEKGFSVEAPSTNRQSIIKRLRDFSKSSKGSSVYEDDNTDPNDSLNPESDVRAFAGVPNSTKSAVASANIRSAKGDAMAKNSRPESSPKCVGSISKKEVQKGQLEQLRPSRSAKPISASSPLRQQKYEETQQQQPQQPRSASGALQVLGSVFTSIDKYFLPKTRSKSATLPSEDHRTIGDSLKNPKSTPNLFEDQDRGNMEKMFSFDIDDDKRSNKRVTSSAKAKPLLAAQETGLPMKEKSADDLVGARKQNKKGVLKNEELEEDNENALKKRGPPSESKKRRKHQAVHKNIEGGLIHTISPPTSINTSNRSSRAGTVARSTDSNISFQRSANRNDIIAEETKTRIISDNELSDIEKAFKSNKNPNAILDDVYNRQYYQLTASPNDNIDAASPDGDISELPTSLPKLELNSNTIDRLPFFNEAISTAATPGPKIVGRANAESNVNNNGKAASQEQNRYSMPQKPNVGAAEADPFAGGVNIGVNTIAVDAGNNFDRNYNSDASGQQTRMASVVHRPKGSSTDILAEKDGDDSGTNSSNNLVFKSYRKKLKLSNIFLIIFAVLFVTAISVFIPFIIIFYRGTEGSFYRFFEKQSSQAKSTILERLGSKYGKELKNQSINFSTEIPHNFSIFDTPSKSPYQNSFKLTNYYTNLNRYTGLSEEYQKDKEIISLMNNSALHNVFYGVDYAPMNVIHPLCGAKERDVMLDLSLLSQVTSRIRTYGMQCSQQHLILESLQKLNLNMTLALGVWIGKNDTINDQQLDLMREVLSKYPRKYFDSIYVGNEVLFREEKKPSEVAKYVQDVRAFVTEKLNWTNLPIGVSEIASKVHPDMIEVSDMIGANIHPFFGGEHVSNATQWVFDYLKNLVEPLNKKVKNPAIMTISEVGWPYGGGKYHSSVAGKTEMQQFLNMWVCEAQKEEYPWFWFEAFDEPWKKVYHSKDRTWETQWGIFTADRRLKSGIELPDCRNQSRQVT